MNILQLPRKQGGGLPRFMSSCSSVLTWVHRASVAVLATLTGESHVEAVGSYSVASSGIDYDFTTGSLPSGTTLSRASTTNGASYFNDSGVMQFAGTDVPRFDYDPVSHAALGLLYEPQSTNYVTYASDFSQSTWTRSKVNAVATAEISPDGATTMQRIVPWPTLYGFGLYSTSLGSGQYSASVFFKPSGYNYTGFRINTGAWQNALVNLIDGVTTYGPLGTPSIQAINNSFIRFKDTYTLISTFALTLVLNEIEPTGGVLTNFTGDGVSGIYMWGTQIEAGSKITSYIPTAGAAATRPADVLQFTIPSGVTTLRYTFDDSSTQDVSVSSGAYTVPTNLNRAHIKRIQSV